MPTASSNAGAGEIATPSKRDTAYQPALVGDVESGKFLMAGKSLVSERTPDEVRRIAPGLD